MTLSIFLIGSVAVIVIIAIVVFAWGLRSGVVARAVPAGGNANGILYASAGQRIVKAVMLTLGVTTTLGKTTLHEFPPSVYKPRYLFNKRWECLHVNKLVTVLLLAAIAVLFSRDFVPKWIGLTWASPQGAVCESPSSKQALFQQQFFDEIRLGESQTQVDAQYVNLRWLQRTMGSSSVFPSPKPYPEACEGAATFVINQGLQKTCATPISGDLGGYGSVYNALNLNGVGSTVTATVDVACPDIAGSEADLSAMGTFKQLQVEKARQPPVVAQEPGPTLIEQVGSFIDTLMFQVDVASTVYIAYAAVCMFFNAPLKLFNTPLSVRLRRTAFRVPKVPFIVVVVFLWWAYSYLLVTISSPEVALYLHNVQTDACFIQPAFYAERNAAIVKSCRTLVNLQTNFTHNLGAITDIANGLSFCNTQCGTAAAASTAFCNGVPRVNFNVLYSSAVAYNTSWHRVSRVPGFGRCDDTIELRSRYLRAPESSVSADFWLQSGLVAQILIKFLLSNFVLAALHTVDPLSESGGVYESDSTVDLKANGRLCAEVHTMLRLQQLRGLAWWSCLSALALANLVYAAAMGPAPTAWDLPSVVVVAAAASVVCAIVCYIFRAQLKVCCTRSARACMACCLRCAVATRNCRCCTKK